MNFNQKVIMAKDYARFYEKKESMKKKKALLKTIRDEYIKIKYN